MPLRMRLVGLLLLVASMAVSACGPSEETALPTPTTAQARPSAATSDRPAASSTTAQTDTDWGRIWDGVPSGFPTYPGSTPANDAGIKGASAVWAIPQGDAKEIADWYQQHLEAATFSTQALSGPLEDQSYVLDSVGDGDCRMEVSVAPAGSLLLVSIRYGAACPNT